MARCGCAGDCLCSVSGGCGITVSGNGTLAAPYTVTADISAAAGNGLSCVADGLYAGASAVTTADTDCIALDGVGSIADPLTASPVFSADDGNVLECREDGLYAPAAGVGAATNFALFEDNGSDPTILPASGSGISTVPVDFDTLLLSAGINAYAVGFGPDYSWAYVEITAAGYYYVAACVQGWGVGPTYTSDANLIVSIRMQPAIGGPEINRFQASEQIATEIDAPGNIPMTSLSGIGYFDIGDKLWTTLSFFDAQTRAFPGATLGTNYPSSAWFNVYRIGV